MKIIIMRHGQPEIDLDSMTGRRFCPVAFGQLVDDYQTTDLSHTSIPTEAALKAANACNAVVTSDLPRAISSVEKLGLSDIAQIDSDYRESAMPYTNWSIPRFSFFVWAITFRLAWLFGFSRNGESFKLATTRAVENANKLHRLAQTQQSVLLLGHGILNRLVIKALKKQGWVKTVSTGEKYWSYTVLEFDEETQRPH